MIILAVIACFCIIFSLFFRACVVFPFINVYDVFKLRQKSPKDHHLMILLGSGGHTGEMMRLLSSLEFQKDWKITWVVTENDANSLQKAKLFSEGLNVSKIDCIVLPRARKVGQSMISSVGTTIYCFMKTVSLIYKLPSLVLCNGPGTSVPLCWICFMMKFVRFKKLRIVYVESLARVKRLSLSGVLLYPIANRFIVQWPELKRGRREYYGLLV